MKEIWLAIEGASGSYEVSNLGGVKSIDRSVGHRWGGIAIRKGQMLKPRKDGSGYLFVTLRMGGISVNAKVHRLVAKHFLPRSGLPEVNHKDLNKSNNAATNLEWVTRKGNQEHASRHGLFAATTNPARAKKLTPGLAEGIRAARAGGFTYAAIAEQFGISAPTALKVVRRDIWYTTAT